MRIESVKNGSKEIRNERHRQKACYYEINNTKIETRQAKWIKQQLIREKDEQIKIELEVNQNKRSQPRSQRDVG